MSKNTPDTPEHWSKEIEKLFQDNNLDFDQAILWTTNWLCMTAYQQYGIDPFEVIKLMRNPKAPDELIEWAHQFTESDHFRVKRRIRAFGCPICQKQQNLRQLNKKELLEQTEKQILDAWLIEYHLHEGKRCLGTGYRVGV